jgi:hypothetical protein
MTLDDMHQGFPCAFKNRTDIIVLKIFFETIKSKVGVLSPKVFMSDMAECFFNSWVQVMSEPENRLFCTWHVIRAWKHNVQNKICCKEKQTEVYQQLITVLEETDLNTFNNLLIKFVARIQNDPATKVFAEYFSQYYTKM